MNMLSRRRVLTASAVLGAQFASPARVAWSAGQGEQIDLTNITRAWETVTGQWAVEDVAGASGNGKALVQRAINNEFNVIVAPGGPYIDVDVSVRFKPMSGREDASGGIVFRFSEGRYYVVRANALEDNFRLYYYDRGRFMLASARVTAPKLGEWHALRVTADKDGLRGWLNGSALIDHRDGRFGAGRVGLWTKADSITAFDSLTVSPKSGG